MEEISSQLAANSKCFDSTCRTCLCDLKETVTYSVNDPLVIKPEDNGESTEPLTIGEVLSRYVFIQASRKWFLKAKTALVFVCKFYLKNFADWCRR